MSNTCEYYWTTTDNTTHTITTGPSVATNETIEKLEQRVKELEELVKVLCLRLL